MVKAGHDEALFIIVVLGDFPLDYLLKGDGPNPQISLNSHQPIEIVKFFFTFALQQIGFSKGHRFHVRFFSVWVNLKMTGKPTRKTGR